MGQPDFDGKQSEAEFILSVAVEMGGRSRPDDIVARCLEMGGWADQLDGILQKALRVRVTNALKTLDPANKLPLYAPTEAGEWVQHSLLAETEMEWIIVQRHKGVIADYKILIRYQKEMIRTYGWAPEIFLTKDEWNADEP